MQHGAGIVEDEAAPYRIDLDHLHGRRRMRTQAAF